MNATLESKSDSKSFFKKLFGGNYSKMRAFSHYILKARQNFALNSAISKTF